MTDKKRVKRYNVRLSSEMSYRLERLAQERGLPPSTLISAVVGEYVATTDYQRAKVYELMSDPEFVKTVKFGPKDQPDLLEFPSFLINLYRTQILGRKFNIPARTRGD